LEEAKEKRNMTEERPREITKKNKESEIIHTTPNKRKGKNVQVTVRQHKQCTYNVTLRRVRAHIVTVEKQ
jgi:hypothetical protein